MTFRAKFAAHKVEAQVHILIHQAIKSFCKNLESKLHKKYSKEKEYTSHHVSSCLKSKSSMSGGTVMPIDFFGTQGAGYLDDVSLVNAPSTSPTTDFIRPPIEQTFQPVLLEGAGALVSISQAAIKKTLQNSKIKSSKASLQLIKHSFEAKLTKALNKLSKKEIVTSQSLQKVLSQKQFSILQG